MITTIINSLLETFKKALTIKGRATKAEFWIFVLFEILASIATGLLVAITFGSILGVIVGIILAVIWLAILICKISLLIRRLHDLNLAGFWLWYLNPAGLPVVYVVYLLDLDPACNKVIEKIEKTGSVWLGWILALLFWPAGATAATVLLLLYNGKDEDNEFGASPYKK